MDSAETPAGPESPDAPLDPAEHTRQLETLAKVARSLTLSVDQASLAREILRWMQVFVPGAAGRFWVVSQDGQTRNRVASVGLRHSPDEPPPTPDRGMGALSVEQMQTMVSLDVAEDPRFVNKAWARAEGLVSSIVLPLVHRQQVHGNLSIYTRSRHHFGEGEIRLLEAFAAVAATVLANASLYQESLAKTERLESLNRVSASLASSLEADDTLQLIVEEAPKLLRLDGGGLRLLEGDRLVLVRQQGLSGRLMIKKSLRIGESLSGRVAEENRPIVVNRIEVDQDITPDHKAAVLAEGATRWIGVPVRHQGRLVGVLVAVGKERAPFTDDDVALLSAFADHAAIALENSRLYTAAQEELLERRKAEEALRRHQDRLEELVKERTASLQAAQEQLVRKERLAALGQLTASVSHELRTPLGTIKASLTALENDLARDRRPSQRLIDRVMRNIDRCDAIISDLQDYTGTTRLRRATVALGPWLDTLLDEQPVPEPVALARRLDGDIEVAVDEHRLRRAVINVVQNALQALAPRHSSGTAAGSTVTVRAHREAQRVLIQVDDDGPGIPPEVLPEIFEPLFSTKGFGMGLGLPIVRQIMEQHGGGVRVDSTPGEGTRVTLWLPCEPGVSCAGEVR